MTAYRVILLAWLLVGLSVGMGCDGSSMDDEPTPYTLEMPERFPIMPIPADNPMTEEGVALGRRLFFDTILSRDLSLSCASCHDPSMAFSDPKPTSIGINGAVGTRNAMPLTNVGWVPQLFWDGRAVSLEEQALHPVVDPLEMGETWDSVVAKLSTHSEYPRLFEEAFQTSTITADLVVKAIAQFERTLISADAKFDRFLEAKADLTPLEQEGFDLFYTERGDCFHCHATRLFTDNDFHNNGLDLVPSDSGLAAITGLSSDVGRFRTPTLRNVEYTAPYMHDGRFETLEAVIDHYSDGVQPAATIDPLMRHGTRRGLSQAEKDALVAFLKTLSDPEFIQEHGGG